MNAFEIILIILLCAALYQIYVVTSILRIWLRCFLAGAFIPFPVLVAMTLRRTSIDRVTSGYLRLVKAGIDANLMTVEADYIKYPRRFETEIDERIMEFDQMKKKKDETK